jgi:Polyketide cyclase / dehydrase and lipid transport
MTRLTVTRDVRATATATWTMLVDWPRHGRWVPLTVVRVESDRPDGVGARFVGRTGVGPLAFDDPMTVVTWEPPGGDDPGDRPGRCEITKHGRLVHGSAAFSVTPLPGRRCRVEWIEDVTVPPRQLARLTGPLVSLIGRAGFAATLRGLARDVEAG